MAAAAGCAASGRGVLAAPLVVAAAMRKQATLPRRRSFDARLRAHAEGAGLQRSALDTPTGVFPRARVLGPSPQASARPAACPLAVERAADCPTRRFSAIDGLPLPPSASPPAATSSAAVAPPEPSPQGRQRSRSRSARPPSVEAPREDPASALYFVDALAHRSHVECAACGRNLGSSPVATGAPVQRCALGFRPARTLGVGAQARWLHVDPACLAHLGLPPAGPCAADVVFSPDVGEASRAEVLRSLAVAASMGTDARQRAAPQGAAAVVARGATRVSTERWSYAVARVQRWGRRRPAEGSRASEEPLAQLPRSRLGARDLAGMRDCSGAAPLCAICMEDFADGDDVVRLPCAHLFHPSCAGEWLRRRPVCPLDLLPAMPEESAVVQTTSAV
uniref:RING-type domain-containing protein n=1 Tax=Alexandrium monilatum TaxID=311494 RepID=A0A7S4UZW2_9DINO